MVPLALVANLATRWHHLHIPDICHFFYTNTFLGLQILHSKVRKFTTKKASRQNSVKPHTLCKITHSMCNYTLCVKLHTVCKITHCVWNSTYSTRFHRGSFRVKYGKNSSHFLHQCCWWRWRQIWGMSMPEWDKLLLRSCDVASRASAFWANDSQRE